MIKTILPNQKVVVKAPATTANLGPGFDVFGMALEQPSDKVTVSPASKGIKIEVTGQAARSIPKNPEKNTTGVVAKAILEEFSLKSGLMIKIEKGIEPGKGLGSSAASAAAAAYGLNKLFNLKLDNKELVRFSAKGEAASAGFEHADNVSAAIYGDFIVIRSYDPLEIVHVQVPNNLSICVAIPKLPAMPNKTERARSVLPKNVPMEKIVHNLGHAASVAVGFATGDVELIGRGMSDVIIEPARAFSIPGYHQVKEKAVKAGACGVAISGAGPAMIAIVNSEYTEVSKVAEAMKAGFSSARVHSDAFCTKPGKGASLQT